ncbi:884_t:CDS:2, partial [Dentiscutata erythropus]
MIQNLPNELQIEILTYVVIEANFQNFCTLRIVCKKWNTFVPLIIHEAATSRLNSGLKVELTCWNDTKWIKNMIKNLAPIYDDYTKTFTFLFDNPEDNISEYLNDKISFIAFVERSEDVPSPIKLGAYLGDLIFPEIINNDVCKYKFDYRNNVCFKREIKDEDKSIGR